MLSFDLTIKVEHILAGLTIIIGGLVFFVAYRQYKLANEKFKLDLFEKRFAVYKGVQEFLTKIMFDGNVKDLKTIDDFRAKTQDAVFLFGDDITNYLKEIDSKALELWQDYQNLDGLPKGEERSNITKNISKLLEWLLSQLPKLKNVFGPYLKFKTWK